jgi:glutamate racemase
MEPAVKPAVKTTRTGVVGVLATAGTLKADKYLNTREKFSEGVKITEHVGQGFVELVEKGCLTGREAEDVVRASLKPLLDEGADRIVLGCTHYPFLWDTIAKTASELYPEREIEIIDPAPAVARHLLETMKTEGLIRKDGFSIILHSSGDDTILNETFGRLK